MPDQKGGGETKLQHRTSAVPDSGCVSVRGGKMKKGHRMSAEGHRMSAEGHRCALRCDTFKMNWKGVLEGICVTLIKHEKSLPMEKTGLKSQVNPLRSGFCVHFGCVNSLIFNVNIRFGRTC